MPRKPFPPQPSMADDAGVDAARNAALRSRTASSANTASARAPRCQGARCRSPGQAGCRSGHRLPARYSSAIVRQYRTLTLPDANHATRRPRRTQQAEPHCQPSASTRDQTVRTRCKSRSGPASRKQSRRASCATLRPGAAAGSAATPTRTPAASDGQSDRMPRLILVVRPLRLGLCPARLVQPPGPYCAVIDRMMTGVVGTASWAPCRRVCTRAMASTMSIPSTTSPKTA